MFFRFANAAAIAAVASMTAAPLAAADFPRTSVPTASGIYGTNAVNAQDHRWHRRDRVDAGDVVAGVLVLGTIAAIASAATRDNRRGDYRYPERYPYPDDRYDYRNRPLDSRYGDSRGIDRAVDMCAREVERNGRLDTIEGADRTATGWRVTGRLANGQDFTCSIGNDGRVETVDYGARGAFDDRQWDDDSYAAARRAQDGNASPAYPGGSVPGDAPDGDVYYGESASGN
ncbi:hypothetical protein GCM10011515_07880 [Tsuneonella deserti]|uniref:Secreted protein n=1 Tax=Tsuneonella deserti TaxID=2035528 RepID=A0ABQ1S2P5_9SPHN|nr:hypothetical protein [Tsuneonella deserti]GGD90644.1 hypothetical protein GCM10011515_07880 [Tsuneonella deserti]